MTGFGRAKIEEAKKNGQWENAGKPSAITEEQIEAVTSLLKQNEKAYINFQGMSPSVKKTYARAYFDAKTDKGREKRLAESDLTCHKASSGSWRRADVSLHALHGAASRQE